MHEKKLNNEIRALAARLPPWQAGERTRLEEATF